MTLYEKKRLICAICLAVAAVGLTTVGILIFTAPQESALPLTTPDGSPSTDAVAPAEDIYVLREHEQRIGIFDADGQLIGTVNLPIVTLPRSEQDRLARGIEVFSREELERLIESYS